MSVILHAGANPNLCVKTIHMSTKMLEQAAVPAVLPALKFVYSFEEGDGKDKRLLGGKGANLCEMTQIGLNVPPGFVIATTACLDYLKQPKAALPSNLMAEVRSHIRRLEQKTGKVFGGKGNPLLVSVRSGSALSMPGMMDTILNLGLNRVTLPALVEMTGNERFAYDAYRRFVQLFGKVALGVSDEKFDALFVAVKREAGVSEDVALRAEDLKAVSERFLELVRQETGRPFPEDVYVQLELAIQAVFRSWMGKRAVDYRREFGITPEMADGTAVNIVTMVFGNLGNDCATGVGFTRDPGTGEHVMFGEYLVNAQGEDVVAGIRTPRPVAELEREMPEMYRQLRELGQKLEAHYREVQDFEFTIENQRLYCLQTRNGKMNATAMVRTSVEMALEGLISRETAVKRVRPDLIEQLLYPKLDPRHRELPLAQGLPASPGAASGQCVFDADRAENLGRSGAKLILVREETKPEDIHGFFAAQGILTSRGGKTSHAAVVARGMGKPCVAGAEGITVDVKLRQARVGDQLIREGDVLTIDGATGKVFLGEIPMVEPVFSQELVTLLSWADELAALRVLANADTPDAARRARDFGAKGIGLCRTERMFNAPDRLPLVVDMILADTREEREIALDRLLPIQRQDFVEIFRVMAPHPVTVRLLDPPIHEFLPDPDEVRAELKHLEHLQTTIEGVNNLASSLHLIQAGPDSLSGLTGPFNADGAEMVRSALAKKQRMLNKIGELHEVNPMLGHRGVRLGLTYPEIYRMQVRAMLEAAVQCQMEGLTVRLEIMVPQVCSVEELRQVKALVNEVRDGVEADLKRRPDFLFGSMIEVVRACMTAESLATEAAFFSFGTNDLTQATYSFSREDAENKFLPLYQQLDILHDNPFEVIDRDGVGKLMDITVAWGRRANPDLKIGICGEHGGNPRSIRFCHQLGLNYVSCSPPRVPVARLAAAHATFAAG